MERQCVRTFTLPILQSGCGRYCLPTQDKAPTRRSSTSVPVMQSASTILRVWLQECSIRRWKYESRKNRGTARCHSNTCRTPEGQKPCTDCASRSAWNKRSGTPLNGIAVETQRGFRVERSRSVSLHILRVRSNRIACGRKGCDPLESEQCLLKGWPIRLQPHW